jgi:CubicO group peptidase (beta-lactamase class C family)
MEPGMGSKLFAGLMGMALLSASMVHADAIDDFVNQELARQKVPGVAVGIMEHGRLVRSGGYGLANLEHNVPVHADTVFQSGSIGKQFTAVAVMTLVEDGKIKLDESIRTYLPKAPKTWQPITVRHMLTHTSGIGGDPGFDLRKDYSDDELLDVIYKVKLDFPPGERWSYSNTAYATLGLMVHKVTGDQTYGDVLAKRVFGPLHMTTARVISDSDIIPNRSAGYETTEKGAIKNQDWVAATGNSTADGSLYLTVLDFAKWDGALRDRKLLKPESWAEVYKPVKLNSGKTYPYGFGWSLEKAPGGRGSYQHGGAWQGFRTFYIRYLDDEISVIVLANASSADPETIARGIAARFEPKLQLPKASPIDETDPTISQRLRRLIEEMVAGKPSPKEYAMAPETLARYGEYYARRLSSQGKLQELRLFRRSELGNDIVYAYRARFENGLMDVGLGLDPSSKVTGLSFSPVEQWDEPLPPL